MNTWPNGTIKVGMDGSYQSLLSAVEDCLKGKPKVFEVQHIAERLKEAGKKAGLTIARMQDDWEQVHKKVKRK